MTSLCTTMQPAAGMWLVTSSRLLIARTRHHPIPAYKHVYATVLQDSIMHVKIDMVH